MYSMPLKPKEHLVFVELRRNKCICKILWTLKLQLCFKFPEIYFISLNVFPQQPKSSGYGRGKWRGRGNDDSVYALLWTNLPFSLMFQIGRGQTVLNVLIQTVNTFNSRDLQTSEKSNSFLPSIPLFTECFCCLGDFFLKIILAQFS